jgi:hypothetical protein
MRGIMEIAMPFKILNKLEAGSMPCDGAWPEKDIETFRQRIKNGKHA